MEALSKCQSVLDWQRALCVRDPGRWSSHQSGWSARLSGCSSAGLAASPPGCSPKSWDVPAGCASWWCWLSVWLAWLHTPCRSGRVSCSRSPSGTPSASAPGSSSSGPSLGSGRGEKAWCCCPSFYPFLRSCPPASQLYWGFSQQKRRPHPAWLQ